MSGITVSRADDRLIAVKPATAESRLGGYVRLTSSPVSITPAWSSSSTSSTASRPNST